MANRSVEINLEMTLGKQAFMTSRRAQVFIPSSYALVEIVVRISLTDLARFLLLYELTSGCGFSQKLCPQDRDESFLMCCNQMLSGGPTEL